MRTLDQQLRYEDLERVSRSPLQAPAGQPYPMGRSLTVHIVNSLKQAGQCMVQWLTQPREPRVWTTQQPDGTPLWHLYDPTSGTRIHTTSENDLRQWLETRYYR